MQVLAGFSDGNPVPKDITAKHRLTLAVTYARPKQEAEMLKLGFKKLGTFNQAHDSKGKLILWAVGGEFEEEASGNEDVIEDKGNK